MMQDNLKSRRVILFILAAGVGGGVPVRWLGEVGVGLGVLGGVWVVGRLVGAFVRNVLRKVDVMTTVDAMKTTNKELKKQYGQINIDKSKCSGWGVREVGAN